MKMFASAMMAVMMLLMSTFAIAEEDKNVEQAKAAASRWLELRDAGDHSATWEQAADPLRGMIAKPAWESISKAVGEPLGTVKLRTLKSATFTKSLPGAPDGEYVVIEYLTEFEHKAKAVETVTPMRDKDGSWKVSGYYIR